MKKIMILIGTIFMTSTLFGQTENQFEIFQFKEYKYDKYPKIDSLKPILLETLIKFQSNKKYSFLNSGIAFNDSLMYSHYNSENGYHMYLDTIPTKEYIETVLDPNLTNFISHPDYTFEILESGKDGFYNAQQKWVIVVMINSEKYNDQLILEFNFNQNNKLQFVSIMG